MNSPMWLPSLATAQADDHDLSVDRSSARRTYGPSARSFRSPAVTVSAWLAELGATARWLTTLSARSVAAIGPQRTPSVSAYLLR